MAVSTGRRGESVLQGAVVGGVTYNTSVRGWSPALGSVTPRRHGPWKAAWIWLVKFPGVKRAAIGVAPVTAANFSTALWPVFLEDMTLISQFLNGNNGTSHLQELLPGPLQIYNVDAITFPLGDVLFHLEVKVGAT